MTDASCSRSLNTAARRRVTDYQFLGVPDFDEQSEYELTAEEARKLRNRVDAYRRELDFKGNVHLTLVTSGGYRGNKHSGIVQSVVTLDDLFVDV